MTIIRMFPPTKFVKTNCIVDQLKHLESELNEIRFEWEMATIVDWENNEKHEERIKNMKLESIDLIHSAQTLLRILGVTDEEFVFLCNQIYIKNKNRGYYD